MHLQHMTALSCLFYFLFFEFINSNEKKPNTTTSLHSRTPEEELAKIATTAAMAIWAQLSIVAATSLIPSHSGSYSCIGGSPLQPATKRL